MVPSDSNSGPLQVRPATAADAAHLVSFNLAMAWETEHKRLDPEVLAAGVRSVFEQPARGRYWVAEAGGVVQGGLMVTYEWSDWRNKWFWWIQSVYISPDFRGRSIYRAMYAFVKELATKRGEVCGFRLYVEKENVHAQKVYEQLGMHESYYLVYEEET